MRLELKDFQEAAVEKLYQQIKLARREAPIGDPQASVLSAPTGSGKTVIATALMERILTGDDETPPDPDATFLWISDQPELNEQSRKKLAGTSSVFHRSRLITIDSAFDRAVFEPGHVYFLNTQKLGRDKQLVTPGDTRAHTIWATITNTQRERPASFIVAIDEAHRGMQESARQRKLAATIIQKFIKGAPGKLEPIGVLLGITATPQRFLKLLEGANRTTRRHDISPDEVRASGLLKETLLLYHPTEDQPSDMTLLQAAGERWRLYRERWRDYSRVDSSDGRTVEPILIIQIEDATKQRVTRTDMREALQVLDAALGPLGREQVAHALQEGQTIELGDRRIRYLPPSEIQDDPTVRVVFFKMALNTGWDCPRAEVMMSFRKAVDHTLIAQLVGRTVRTPLGRRVESDELLNSVSLYLPHYDREGLDKVVDRLTSADPDYMPPIEVRRGAEIVELGRAEDSDDLFASLSQIPSYYVQRVRKQSNVRRMMKLARLLSYDGLRPEALATAKKLAVSVLDEQLAEDRGSERLGNIVKESGVINLREVALSFDGPIEETVQELPVTAENVDDLFVWCGRRLGEGLHKEYWRRRVKDDPTLLVTAKLELFALCSSPETLESLEQAAGTQIKEWQDEHRTAINDLSDDRRGFYQDIRRTAIDPESIGLAFPHSIQWPRAETTWPKHVYTDEDGVFPCKLNSWESRIIEEELARPDFVAWLRNPVRKEWSLTIPYRLGDERKAFYPDFLVLRTDNGSIAVDIIDPHSESLADAWAKAVGLAEYAAKHAHQFGRIQTAVVRSGTPLRLELTDEDVRRRVLSITNTDQLSNLYSE